MAEQDQNIVPMDDQPAKPQYIENQTNNNCQQFYGPISNCVFAMPGATVYQQPAQAPTPKPKAEPKPKPSRSPRTPKPKPAKTKEHGVERDTFSCSKHITPNHLKLLLQQLQEVGWVSTSSNDADFRALFSGKVSSCEIIWTGEVGLGTLKELFNAMLDEQLISLPGGARSVNSVLENHFVDASGHFVSDLNSSLPADSSFQTINKLVEILKVRLKTDDIQKEFNDLESWDPSYH